MPVFSIPLSGLNASSTALSTKLDPEDLRSVIGAYHRCVAERVARFDGFTAKYMGDGVLAYFGYPQAHEHDAERAVQAGLALNPGFTRRRYRDGAQSDNPVFLKGRERIIEDMRKAGVPEG